MANRKSCVRFGLARPLLCRTSLHGEVPGARSVSPDTHRTRKGLLLAQEAFPFSGAGRVYGSVGAPAPSRTMTAGGAAREGPLAQAGQGWQAHQPSV